jgi:hypothetical protein
MGVPESSTWAMMLLGFAVLGYVGYRRSARLGSKRAFVIYRRERGTRLPSSPSVQWTLRRS